MYVVGVEMGMNVLEQYFETFTREAFRLELLDQYLVPEEEEEYKRFLLGELFPRITEEDEWLSLIRHLQSTGKEVKRVHVVPPQLTPYLKFEIEWGYAYSARAGELIYLITAHEFSRLHPARLDIKDFWLFDESACIELHYGQNGKFQGFHEVVKDRVPDYTHLKRRLTERAQPLREFLKDYRRRTT